MNFNGATASIGSKVNGSYALNGWMRAFMYSRTTLNSSDINSIFQAGVGIYDSIGRQVNTIVDTGIFGYTTSYSYYGNTTGTPSYTVGSVTNNGNAINYTYEDNGTDKMYYTYDANGWLVSINYNGTEYYYIKNSQGDIMGLFDSTGIEVTGTTTRRACIICRVGITTLSGVGSLMRMVLWVTQVIYCHITCSHTVRIILLITTTLMGILLQIL